MYSSVHVLNFVCVQVNLDGFALPIKKLKGTDPVESLDFSNKGLRPASAIVIASLIGDNASLTQVCQIRQVLVCGVEWSPTHTHTFSAF